MWSHISSWALFLPLSAKKREGNRFFRCFLAVIGKKVLYLQSKYKRKLADKIWIIYQ